jgi:hypothetical protein
MKTKKTSETKNEAQEVDQSIKIPPIELKIAKITLVGDSPLLVCKFSEKAKNQLDEKHQKKAKSAREARKPQEEFEASLYTMGKNKYGIPAAGVKKCAVSACRFIEGIPMTIAKGSFHVMEEKDGLIAIESDGPVMDERIVRVGTFGNKKPMTRYRGRFDQWKITFTVRYNSKAISAEQLLNLYENAGFAVGLCEYRPEKDGNLGLFHVARN